MHSRPIATQDANRYMDAIHGTRRCMHDRTYIFIINYLFIICNINLCKFLIDCLLYIPFLTALQSTFSRNNVFQRNKNKCNLLLFIIYNCCISGVYCTLNPGASWNNLNSVPIIELHGLSVIVYRYLYSNYNSCHDKLRMYAMVCKAREQYVSRMVE